MMADAPAENQSSDSTATVGFPSAASARRSAIPPTMPTWMIPSTMMNRPTKKKIVDHSTWGSVISGWSPTRSIRTVAPSNATVATSTRRTPWSRKPTIVSAVTTRAFTSSPLSVITRTFVASTASRRRSSGTLSVVRKATAMIPAKAAKIRITTGARFHRNAPNPSPAAEPMRMLGGSPISVAVPPMLDARICAIRYGAGEIPRRRETERVTGVISTTVVTLSNSAETTAVTRARIRSSRIGWPADTTTDRIASHSKNPVRPRIDAMIIIPTSRKMTLKSIAANACRWSTIPSITIARPARSAISVRSQRSTAIRM